MSCLDIPPGDLDPAALPEDLDQGAVDLLVLEQREGSRFGLAEAAVGRIPKEAATRGAERKPGAHTLTYLFRSSTASLIREMPMTTQSGKMLTMGDTGDTGVVEMMAIIRK